MYNSDSTKAGSADMEVYCKVLILHMKADDIT